VKSDPTIKEAAENLLRDKGFYCHACNAHRKTTVIEGSKQKCPKCGAWLLESDMHFLRVLKHPDTDKKIKKYMRRLLRADWPLCEHCHKRFKNLDKHVTRKHDIPAPQPEMF